MENFIFFAASMSTISWSSILFFQSVFISVKIWAVFIKAVAQGCSIKKVVLKNFAKSTEKHLCWSHYLTKLRPEACNFIKQWLQRKCFPVDFAKLLRTPILQNICKWQLLYLGSCWTSMMEFVLRKQLHLFFVRTSKILMRLDVLMSNL